MNKRLATWKGCLFHGVSLLSSYLLILYQFLDCENRLSIYWINWDETFFWKGCDKVSGFHRLVNWGLVCKSKDQDGLGVEDLTVMNQSLCAKWAWKYLKGSAYPWWSQMKCATILKGNRASDEERIPKVFHHLGRVFVGKYQHSGIACPLRLESETPSIFGRMSRLRTFYFVCCLKICIIKLWSYVLDNLDRKECPDLLA